MSSSAESPSGGEGGRFDLILKGINSKLELLMSDKPESHFLIDLTESLMSESQKVQDLKEELSKLQAVVQEKDQEIEKIEKDHKKTLEEETGKLIRVIGRQELELDDLKKKDELNSLIILKKDEKIKELKDRLKRGGRAPNNGPSVVRGGRPPKKLEEPKRNNERIPELQRPRGDHHNPRHPPLRSGQQELRFGGGLREPLVPRHNNSAWCGPHHEINPFEPRRSPSPPFRQRSPPRGFAQYPIPPRSPPAGSNQQQEEESDSDW